MEPILKNKFVNDMAQATAYMQFLGQGPNDLALQHQKAQQKEDIYKSVFDTVSDAILVINSEGEIEDLNAVAKKLLLGRKRKGQTPLTRGALFSEVFNGDDDGFKFSLTVDRCVRLGIESSFNAVHDDQGGGVRYLQANIRPIELEAKNAALVVIKDNTKKVINERTLHKAKLKAESSDLAKTQFLANISHEVRTPMNIIMGYAGLAAESGLSDQERGFFIDKILDSGKQLMGLLDKALEVSSGHNETVGLTKSEFPLFPALKALMKEYDSERLDVNLSFRLPLNQKVRTDRERLAQALSNLMDNAMKFTKEGSVELIVEEFNGRVSFCVADTGIGVSRDQWKRLFNPFTQADESFTRDFGGCGLGLAVVKHLAKLLGGGARVKESTPGLGSVFEVWLEDVLVTANKDCSKQRGVDLKKERPSFPNLCQAKILLVEDVEENRFLIKHYLKEIKCRVDTATDGEDAIRKLNESSYDLILMDLQMPRLDGYGATHLIRKKGLDMPIIALTAHNLRKDIEKCKRAGFSGHLSKPVAQAQLLSKVHTALGKSI